MNLKQLEELLDKIDALKKRIDYQTNRYFQMKGQAAERQLIHINNLKQELEDLQNTEI